MTTRSEFWNESQPGFKFSDNPPGAREFFADVREHRYTLEPHIPQIARWRDWHEKDVLDVGCGVGTDGARFASHGARYTGLDESPTAIELARRNFDFEGIDGDFVRGDATALPFEGESFDLVWSHGVIHHIPDTERAVAEMHRVLRPGGTALVMLYHRDSFNYWVTIMGIRRALAALLLVPHGPAAVAAVTREDRSVLEAHRQLLREYGLRYLRDRQLFLNHNTDGPGNPLSKVYSRHEARQLFAGFRHVQTAVRYLNLRIFPGGQRLARLSPLERLGRRAGWHLYVRATK